MGILSAIGSFVGANWKILGIAMVAIFAYWKVSSWVGDYIEEQKAEERILAELTTSRDKAIIESLSLQATMWEMQANEARINLLQQETSNEQTQVQEKADAEKKTFEGHDLGKMSQRHPEWLEKIFNEGSEEHYEELADLINSD